VVVANEPKITLLRKNSGLIVDGPILEAENETRHHPIPSDGLGKITRSKNFALQRAECEETVDRSLGARVWIRRARARAEKERSQAGSSAIGREHFVREGYRFEVPLPSSNRLLVYGL